MVTVPLYLIPTDLRCTLELSVWRLATAVGATGCLIPITLSSQLWWIFFILVGAVQNPVATRPRWDCGLACQRCYLSLRSWDHAIKTFEAAHTYTWDKIHRTFLPENIFKEDWCNKYTHYPYFSGNDVRNPITSIHWRRIGNVRCKQLCVSADQQWLDRLGLMLVLQC